MFKLSGTRVLLALIMLVALVATGAVNAGADWREKTNSQAAESSKTGGQCVRDTEFMRRNHMELIKHDRDVTVHQGIRTVDGSLSACISCHANKGEDGHYIPVDAEQGIGGEQFCAGFHSYTGVSMDCFQCHATTPGE